LSEERSVAQSDFAVYPSLRGRAVFVTGGASGIGAAIVAAFHGQGSKVAFVDRDRAAGETLAARLPGVRFTVCDVTEPGALEHAIAETAAGLGPVGVLINNVADDTRHAADATDGMAWRAALAVNLDPAFLASRAVHAGMKAAGGGAIVNLSSINALLGPPDMAAYVAAKGAINALTKALAREWGGDAVRVNAISPGWVVTERQLALWLSPQAEAAWMEQVALQRRILPDDVARLALFLASDDAGAITGQNLVIDGGRT
jgi:NAD(P)-dependent dehydrogenase (short-subunit alcohol dehydrogenase family)